MKLIHRIDSLKELKSFRDQVGRVIESQLGSPVKGRKLDEIAAQLLGEKNWNTAQGRYRNTSQVRSSKLFNEPGKFYMAFSQSVAVCHTLLLVLLRLELAEEEQLQEILDDAVMDFSGFPNNRVSSLNNQGWKAQIEALHDAMALSRLRERLVEETGVLKADMDRFILYLKKEITGPEPISSRRLDDFADEFA